MARLYASNVSEARLIDLLAPLFKACREEHQTGEYFGDFLHRTRRLDSQAVDL